MIWAFITGGILLIFGAFIWCDETHPMNEGQLKAKDWLWHHGR